MLQRFEAHQFRCFRNLLLDIGGRSTALVGPNASGKTSILEGVYFLSYGRSFRVADRRQLVRRGELGFKLAADVSDALGSARLEVQWTGGKLTPQINERSACGIGELASRTRVHLIDPGVHRLIEGQPQERRRLLDTGVFHVEPTYLSRWQEYRRALRQRNAELRRSASIARARPWDAVLCVAAEAVDSARLTYIGRWSAAFRQVAASLGLLDASLSYRSGRATGLDLAAALSQAGDRDAVLGSTSVGPHRADVRILLGGVSAKSVVSRGQQKLLAAALVLSQLRLVEQGGEKPLLLIDDAGAELDVDNLGKFLRVVSGMHAQLLVTSTFPASLESLENLAMFHVKQDGTVAML